jgi:dienelactone hydrolase
MKLQWMSLTLPAILVLARLGAAAEVPSFASPGPYPVGVKTVVLVDPARQDPYVEGGRTLVTEIWYPAVDEARQGKTTRFVDFFGDHPEAADAFVRYFGGNLEDVNRRFVTRGVRGAPLRQGKFPLLVFSHGNGGLRHQNVFQMDHLASHGYIVASPDHIGNAGVTVLASRVVPYDRKGRGRSTVDRPKDLSFIIDRLSSPASEELAWLRGAIDTEAIGLLGHSFGGFASCQAASADKRVKAILPMTVVGPRPAPVPCMVMLAELDRTIGEAGNMLDKGYFVSAGPPKYLLILKRGGHFSFSDMDKINPSFGDGIGTETKRGKTVTFLPPELTKEIIKAYTLAFFECHLRKSAEAREFLRRNAYPEEVEYQCIMAEGSPGKPSSP